jgi:cell wall-associated NlpC family hydrolase
MLVPDPGHDMVPVTHERTTMRTFKLKPVTAAVSLIIALNLAIAILCAGDLRTGILDTAKKYIGARYNYGGISTEGFDCSGFVQFVYRENGIALPRSTVDQFEKGKKIDFNDAKPGDLVFFRIYRNRISHVGIFISKSQFIHAPSRGKRVGYADMNLEYWQKSFAGTVTYIDR